MRAVIAPDASETVLQVAAVHELADHLRDNRAQKAETRLETLFVGGKEGVEVPGQALPEGRIAGFALAVGLHLPGYMQTSREILHQRQRLARTLALPCWTNERFDVPCNCAGLGASPRDQ